MTTTSSPTLFAKPKRRTNRVRGRSLTIRPHRRHSNLAFGSHLAGLLEGAGIPRQWCHEERAFMFPANRTDDLIAFAEHVEGRVVTVEGSS